MLGRRNSPQEPAGIEMACQEKQTALVWSEHRSTEEEEGKVLKAMRSLLETEIICFSFFFLFVWLHLVLVAAHEIFVVSLWIFPCSPWTSSCPSRAQ